jgi:outer membrane protein OmpA-like peptidoglycan-associated protein
VTEHSPGEHNIESLAKRAKQTLERVRVSIDDLDSTLFDDTLSEDSVSAADDVDALDEVEEGAARDNVVASVVAGDEPAKDLSQELGPIDVDDLIDDDRSEGKPDRETDRESSDDAEDDRRKLTYLLPLLLIGLLAILLLVFWGDIFGSSDNDDLSNDQESSSEAVTTSAPDGSTAADTDAATEAPQTTSTAAPTTDAPSTAEPVPEVAQTAWALLGESSGTRQFASLAGPLGLQALLEAQTDDEGNPVEFTLLAPSDDAVSSLAAAQLNTLATDPAAAEVLVSYHFLDQRFTPALLLEAAGGQILSRVGLPIDVSLDGDDVILNGTARVALGGLEALNGNVLVIDTVLEPPTINAVIDLGTIQFEVLSSVITPAGQAELQKAVDYFAENAGVNALIEGHTDTDGPSEPNQRLSDRRANAVGEFLISQHIDGTRLTAEGFGESQPIIIDGVEDKVASRRIELKLR